jgi:hypothetical protein
VDEDLMAATPLGYAILQGTEQLLVVEFVCCRLLPSVSSNIELTLVAAFERILSLFGCLHILIK